jgi:hypothetical protein
LIFFFDFDAAVDGMKNCFKVKMLKGMEETVKSQQQVATFWTIGKNVDKRCLKLVGWRKNEERLGRVYAKNLTLDL